MIGLVIPQAYAPPQGTKFFLVKSPLLLLTKRKKKRKSPLLLGCKTQTMVYGLVPRPIAMLLLTPNLSFCSFVGYFEAWDRLLSFFVAMGALFRLPITMYFTGELSISR